MSDERCHGWIHHGGGREELVPANHHRAEVQFFQQDPSYAHEAFALHSSVVAPNNHLLKKQILLKNESPLFKLQEAEEFHCIIGQPDSVLNKAVNRSQFGSLFLLTE